jgi:hypothetical protein
MLIEKLNTWHFIDGKWVHLIQMIEGNEIKYYVDGELTKVQERNIYGNPTLASTEKT